MAKELIITKSIQKKIVRQILRLCEKQYRKGFQHGFHAAKLIEPFGSYKELTTEEVDNWRTKGSIEGYRKIIDPETGGKRHPSFIMGEIAMDDMDALHQFLFDLI